MEVEILKFVGYILIMLIMISAYSVITVVYEIEDKTCVFPVIMFVLTCLIIAFINRNLDTTYTLDRVVMDSDIEVEDDKVYVGDLEIKSINIYALNFYKRDNYLLDSASYAYLCPGLKMNSNDKILVVNKGVADGILEEVSVLNINDSVDLHKFVNELYSSKTVDTNYDKSISGILGKNEEKVEKVEEEEKVEAVGEVGDVASEDNGVSTEESIIELKNSIDTIEKELESLDSSELEQKVSAIENEVSTLKTSLEKLEKEIKEVKNTKNQTNQLVISDANIRTVVASIVVLVLLSIFVYGRVIKINTNSKKELLVTASEAKIREGVMLDNKE